MLRAAEGNEAGAVEIIRDDADFFEAGGHEDRRSLVWDLGVYFDNTEASWAQNPQGDFSDSPVEHQRIFLRCENSHMGLPTQNIPAHFGLLGNHHIRRIGRQKIERAGVALPLRDVTPAVR